MTARRVAVAGALVVLLAAAGVVVAQRHYPSATRAPAKAQAPTVVRQPAYAFNCADPAVVLDSGTVTSVTTWVQEQHGECLQVVNADPQVLIPPMTPAAITWAPWCVQHPLSYNHTRCPAHVRGGQTTANP